MTDLPDEMFLVAPDGGDTATLSFSRSPTVLLTFAANRFTRNASRYYQDHFGIGAMDWRMLVMLTRAPGCSAAQASRTIGIDKAAVSRSLARLEDSGLAFAESEGNDERRKNWTLTPKGRDLHDRILKTALERQKELLSGFSPQEVTEFTGHLRRLLENLDRLA
ncbi:MarR family winged helix-turn-helix transcriptional regulator [Mameliella sediminis]|uniref:MarR family winged helix-turn-helix transcriptional regulator n=1 Tax=Mameliella sediminis TaxID=2836866 RepID=UPI001C495A34|nr:MarR family transcriptional regulator [Mameliella sediminis]MBV7397178.1 MarR family transcriptional regulator [Mameliella sediminis]